MRITSLSVSNYKSLRQIRWQPGPLTVVIGANASGKSNLADFHDFLSDLYRHGLSVAVARKGGYENITHRKMRRSRGAVAVELTAEVSRSDMRAWPMPFRTNLSDLRLTHSFSFRAEGRSIRSDFRIEQEYILLERYLDQQWQIFAEITRTGDDFQHKLLRHDADRSDWEQYMRRMFRFLDLVDEEYQKSLPSTELLVGSIGRSIPLLRWIADRLGAIHVFQISPTNSRQFGVPIPNPEMDRYGGNLPAVVDMIMTRHSRIWTRIMDVMRQLLPGLVRIDVDYTHSRTLGLYFHEKGVGRPWTVDEVSDGTIHSLALLVALFDPRAAMLVLEEPENSVHTWILRTLMAAAIEAAQSKQIVLTTHSRVVIDATKPKDVWVMWRERGESRLAQISALDSDVFDLVEQGGLTTFEVLDTGAIPQALPPPPKL